MLSKILTTNVDELVEIVKNNENCTISFVKNKLNLPLELIEKWLVVLEEYGVLEVHYKGFEGFISYKPKKANVIKSQINLEDLKGVFIKKAKLRNLTNDDMKILWPKFVMNFDVDIHNLFIEIAKKRNYDDVAVKNAWEKYKEELIIF